MRRHSLRIASLMLGSVMALDGVSYAGSVFPPEINKFFGVASIAVNGTTSLTFNIANPNTSIVLLGVAFTDTLPAGMIVATPNGVSSTCGGTATATAGSATVSLSGGTLAANGTCTLSVNVTGTTPGLKSNFVTVSSTNGGTGNTKNADITVVAPTPTPVPVVPTLRESGMFVFGLLMAAAGLLLLVRRR